ncbi:hypothetical protein ANAPC5_01194 [Anaplasma phagocytophilum]|nr:hypothetical protein ANAPC5_01194 [Anaplasma phagocytophilum]
MGKDTADCGCIRFTFHGAINVRATGTDIAQADCRQKHRSPLRTGLSHVPVPQIAQLMRFSSNIVQCPTGIGAWAVFQNFYVRLPSQKNGMGDLSGEDALTRFYGILRFTLRWTAEEATSHCTNSVPCGCPATFGRGAATREAHSHVILCVALDWQGWLAASTAVHHKVQRRIVRGSDGKLQPSPNQSSTGTTCSRLQPRRLHQMQATSYFRRPLPARQHHHRLVHRGTVLQASKETRAHQCQQPSNVAHRDATREEDTG